MFSLLNNNATVMKGFTKCLNYVRTILRITVKENVFIFSVYLKFQWSFSVLLERFLIVLSFRV